MQRKTVNLIWFVVYFLIFVLVNYGCYKVFFEKRMQKDIQRHENSKKDFLESRRLILEKIENVRREAAQKAVFDAKVKPYLNEIIYMNNCYSHFIPHLNRAFSDYLEQKKTRKTIICDPMFLGYKERDDVKFRYNYHDALYSLYNLNFNVLSGIVPDNMESFINQKYKFFYSTSTGAVQTFFYAFNMYLNNQEINNGLPTLIQTMMTDSSFTFFNLRDLFVEELESICEYLGFLIPEDYSYEYYYYVFSSLIVFEQFAYQCYSLYPRANVNLDSFLNDIKNFGQRYGKVIGEHSEVRLSEPDSYGGRQYLNSFSLPKIKPLDKRTYLNKYYYGKTDEEIDESNMKFFKSLVSDYFSLRKKFFKDCLDGYPLAISSINVHYFKYDTSDDVSTITYPHVALREYLKKFVPDHPLLERLAV